MMEGERGEQIGQPEYFLNSIGTESRKERNKGIRQETSTGYLLLGGDPQKATWIHGNLSAISVLMHPVSLALEAPQDQLGWLLTSAILGSPIDMVGKDSPSTNIKQVVMS